MSNFGIPAYIMQAEVNRLELERDKQDHTEDDRED